MGLKGSGPFFQQSIAIKVLVDYVTNISEVYIYDVLIHGDSDKTYLSNTQKVLERLRSKRVTANPKTSLGLDKVEYVGHLVSSDGISFTQKKEKRCETHSTHSYILYVLFCLICTVRTIRPYLTFGFFQVGNNPTLTSVITSHFALLSL